jgi:hypothetical protein
VDILAIILACSLHPDDALVRTLVDVQSGDTVLFVGDLSTLTMNDGLRTAADALRFVEQVRRRGGRPAVGLLGIPLDWASRYGLREADLFDACTNIAVGTAALSEYYDRCSGRHWRRSRMTPASPLGHSPRRRARPPARACILARFAADLGVKGAPATILTALANNPQERTSGPIDQPPERSAIFGAEPPDKVEGSQWVDASERSPTTNRSKRIDASDKKAPTRPAGTPAPASDQLRVLPGPLPPASAAAATRVPPAQRRR